MFRLNVLAIVSANRDPGCGPRFAVVGFGRIVDPDGRGHHPLPDAHLRPPPEPHWDRQVRLVMPVGGRSSDLPRRAFCRTDSMLEVLIAYAVSTGEHPFLLSSICCVAYLWDAIEADAPHP